MLSPFSIEIDEVKPASEPSVAHSAEELDEEELDGEEEAVVSHVLELQAPAPVAPALGPPPYTKEQLSPSDFPLQATTLGWAVDEPNNRAATASANFIGSAILNLEL
jgi:hypothetical protein